MRCGIVDIGSNTVRAVVYDVDVKSQIYREIINEKEHAELLSYIENDHLTEDGIDTLLSVLSRMKNICSATMCDCSFYFATSALRDIGNRAGVLFRVKTDLGIDIDVISGDEESRLDCLSLKASTQLPECLGFDLGGGSGQIFHYRKDNLLFSTSEPIGCLRLYNLHVSGVFPTARERLAIEKTVRQCLRKKKMASNDLDVIYGMGGTARACMRLHQKLLGVDRSKETYTLTFDELAQLEEVLIGMGLRGIKTLNRLIPDRLCTIIPGLIAIRAIMKYTGTRRLCIIRQGVREGYLISHVLMPGSEMK